MVDAAPLRRLDALARVPLGLCLALAASGSCRFVCDVPEPLVDVADGDGPADEPGAEDVAAVDGEVDAEPRDDAADDRPGAEDGEAACRNGVVEAPEECDDGNDVDDDGCGNDCRYSCHEAADCADGDECTADACAPGGTGRICTNTAAPGTPCDDGDECTQEDECDGAGSCAGTPRAPAAPAPLSPENGAPTGSFRASPALPTLRPLFRWRPPADDGCGDPAYEIQVDDSCTTPGFASCPLPSPEAAASAIAGLQWRPTEDLAVGRSPPVGRRYYWRVRACRAASCSAWSRVRYADVGHVPSDVNGDGWSDLIIGAPQGDRAGGSGVGRVDVHYGGPGLDDVADVVRIGEAAGDLLGFSVAAAGDVRVFLGGAPPDGTVDLAWGGEAAEEGLGAAVAAAGDVNGDGRPDLIAGAPASDAEGIGAGRAYLFLGGDPPATAPEATFTGAAGDRLGHSVAAARPASAP
jgi:cysteine-rich repeat protein